MIKIPEPVLIFYILVSVVAFLFRFIKDGSYKQLSLKPLLGGLGLFAAVVAPFIGLLFVAQHFALEAGGTIAYFAGAAGLSFLLGRVGLPSYLRGILLLGASVALTSIGAANFVSLASALTGLIAVKFTENLGLEKEASFDDLLPPFIWLSSAMWLSGIESGKDLGIKAGVILGTMAVSLFMRLIQGPFVQVDKPADDKIFLKRTVLSVSAGLGVLCVMVKLLNVMQFQNLAILCGGAYFVTYLYKDLCGEGRYALAGQQSLRLLMFIGILTLLATRLFGTFGLLALAPAAMVAPLSTAALFPGIFFASRALLQVYLQHFNMNVTGINLTHAYAGAAQYGGFLLALAMLLLLKERMNRRVLLALSLAVCIVTPVLSNFILHSEPTCSLFVSATVAAFLLAVAAPSLQNNGTSSGAENLSLLPALMISSGILSSGLLETGSTATIAVKSTVLSYGIVFTIVLAFISWFFFQRKGQTPGSTPTPSADGA